MPCSGSLDWTVVRLATWRRYILAKVELKNFPVTVYLCVCAHVHVYCSLCTYISEYFSWSPYHVPVWSALSSEGTGTCCVVLCCVVLCCVVLCCALAHCCLMCVLCCCCIAEGGSESPETSSEFLSRVNPSILELPDPTHSLSALPEGRNS